MQFNFTVEELSFIVKRFKFRELVGFTRQPFKEASVIESLMAKKYLTPYKSSYELPNELRALFSAWLNTQYTVVREDFINDDHVFALLASNHYIISYSEHFDDITVALSSFDETVMDTLLMQYLNMDEHPADTSAQGNYNLTFSSKDFLDYFGEKRKSAETVADKTGLSKDEILELWNALSCDDNLSVILQDLVNDIGCMIILHRTPDAYVMFKHITPNTGLHKQRVIVAKGSAQKIVDSIYIL